MNIYKVTFFESKYLECESVVISLKDVDEVEDYTLPLKPMNGGVESIELLGISNSDKRCIIQTSFNISGNNL